MSDAFVAIIRYVSEHPNANDTLQGVMQWWLLDEDTPWSRGEVLAAIARAVGSGLIAEFRGADGQIRYSLTPGKLREARKLLEPGDD